MVAPKLTIQFFQFGVYRTVQRSVWCSTKRVLLDGQPPSNKYSAKFDCRAGSDRAGEETPAASKLNAGLEKKGLR